MSVMNKVLVFLIVIFFALGVSLLVPEVREAIIQLAVYGRLSIGDTGPSDMKIYIQNEAGDWVECPEPPNFANCYKEINPDNYPSVETVPIRAEIYDQNGDCDSGYNVNAYVCMNQTGSNVCNENFDDPDGGSPTMTYLAKENNWCNYTGTYNTLDYWKKYGTWYINVTAWDNNIPSAVYSITRKWYSTMRGSLVYPYPDGDTSSIYLGDVNLGTWTENRGENVTRNTGNVRLNISWQATNFTCPLCSPQTDIVIDNSNEFFCIDNDANQGNGCVYFDAVPLTTIWHFPTDGMRRCGSDTCSQDEDGNTGVANKGNYTTWYHIWVATGKTSGDYNNTIHISSYTCDPPTSCGSGF